ncbi:MAG: O-methyltransferase [bacterium]
MAVYNDEFARYTTALFAAEDDALRAAREESLRAGLPAISIQAEEGRFLGLLARAVGARRAVEIGTLGGYSAIWIARGLAPGGRLITIDASSKHASVARANVARAGLDCVEVREGNAHQLLPKLTAEGPFDFCFIDAEKVGYDAYLTWALANVRVGGAIAAHNAFRGGELLEAAKADADTVAMRAVNERFAREPRLAATIFPAGDGTLFGIVREST